MNFPAPETGLAATLKPATVAGTGAPASTATAADGDFAQTFAALPRPQRPVQEPVGQASLPSDALEKESESDPTTQDEAAKESTTSSHTDTEAVSHPAAAKAVKTLSSTAKELQQTDITESPAPVARRPQSAPELLHALSNHKIAQISTSATAPVPRLAVPNSGQADAQAPSTHETNARPASTPAANNVATIETRPPTKTDSAAKPTFPDGNKPLVGPQTTRAHEIDAALTVADARVSRKGEDTDVPTARIKLKGAALDMPPSEADSNSHKAPIEKTTAAPLHASMPVDQQQSLRPPAESLLLDTTTNSTPTTNKMAPLPQDRGLSTDATRIKPHSGDTPSPETPSRVKQATIAPQELPAVHREAPAQHTMPQADQRQSVRQPAELPLLDTATVSTPTTNKITLPPQNRGLGTDATKTSSQSSDIPTQQSLEAPSVIKGAATLPQELPAAHRETQAAQTAGQADQKPSARQPAGLSLLDTTAGAAPAENKLAFMPQSRELNAKLTNVPLQSSEITMRQSTDMPPQIETSTPAQKELPAANRSTAAQQSAPHVAQPQLPTGQPVTAGSAEQTVQPIQIQPASTEQTTQSPAFGTVQVGVATPVPAQARATSRGQNTRQTVESLPLAKTTPNTPATATSQVMPSTLNTSQGGLSAQLQADADQTMSLLAPSDAGDILSWDASRPLALQTGTQHPLRADMAPQIARQMADAMPMAAQRPVEIALSPEELGRVRMSITTDDGSITVNILTERPETLDLMRRHIDQLGQTFRSMGYEQITFAFGQGADASDQGATGEGSQDSDDTRTTSSDEVATTQPPSETLTPLHTGTTGVDIRL